MCAGPDASSGLSRWASIQIVLLTNSVPDMALIPGDFDLVHLDPLVVQSRSHQSHPEENQAGVAGTVYVTRRSTQCLLPTRLRILTTNAPASATGQKKTLRDHKSERPRLTDPGAQPSPTAALPRPRRSHFLSPTTPPRHRARPTNGLDRRSLRSDVLTLFLSPQVHVLRGAWVRTRCHARKRPRPRPRNRRHDRLRQPRGSSSP
ncbi:hypothetical protein SAMN05421783_14128 [Thiocapsa roseopersicina]|uniref:Uncharacterized protein n=1 Tax=Thiocapsa roseopersicina TaxID=1058 RepID=A0A1H3D2I9_THIRO|nr:hypothetical protein SAMN05421783_14128 [Thiocapsa roseopersicina]